MDKMWLSKLNDPDSYCVFCTIPREHFAKADAALISIIGTAPVWVPHVNEVLSMMGLGLGVFIGAIRAWKVWRDRNTKD